MSVKIPSLLCCVTLEQFKSVSDFTVIYRMIVNEANVMIGRNHNQIIAIRITDRKTGQQIKQFTIKSYKSFKLNTRFANEGKCCLTLNDYNIRILVSNCAINELSLFLKCFAIKCVNDDKENELSGDNRRKRSENESAFDTISPLTTRDLKQRLIDVKHNLNIDNSPKSAKTNGALKRKRNVFGDNNNNNNNNSVDNKRLMVKTLLPSPVRQMKTLNVNNLNSEQTNVMNAVLYGKNVFFTGSAGTGKSYLLKYIIARLPPESTFVTASTGVAAQHIGGSTLHQFCGIVDINSVSANECAKKIISKPSKMLNWKKCKCLIVDEISMISGSYFNYMESVARVVRACDSPFGGIQIVVCGDFLQLPPITKHNDKRVFCFESEAWNQSIECHFELTKVKRQTDQTFVNILQSIRIGKCNDFVKSVLINTATNNVNVDGFTATKLFSCLNDVNFVNNKELKNLHTKSYFYDAYDSDSRYTCLLDSVCPTIKKLELKIGAQVMLNKNVDVLKGLVNGLCGQIIDFDSCQSVYYPKIRFTNGCVTTVKCELWSLKVLDNKCVYRSHLPLQLSWAMSIHKSQGMTIEFIEISLLRAFECGQTYVALSRAKSLKGLRVTNFNPKSIIVDSTVLNFYNNLKYM